MTLHSNIKIATEMETHFNIELLYMIKDGGPFHIKRHSHLFIITSDDDRVTNIAKGKTSITSTGVTNNENATDASFHEGDGGRYGRLKHHGGVFSLTGGGWWRMDLEKRTFVQEVELYTTTSKPLA